MVADARAAVLVATLGAEPQIVAIAVQLLLRRQENLQQVVVLHTDPHHEPVASSLRALQAAFAAQPGWPPLHTVDLGTGDVLHPAALNRFADTLYSVLKAQVEAGQCVHLLLAGGRKPMAMMGMSVAQMLLGPRDRVWYLHSDDDLRTSGRHILGPADRADLVPIPLPPLGNAPAAFTRPFQAQTPADALRLLEAEQHERRRTFVERELTPAEREVARLIAAEVLSVEEVAARLHKSPKTVTNQLNSIYGKLENVFGLQPDKGVKREFLRRELNVYFRS